MSKLIIRQFLPGDQAKLSELYRTGMDVYKDIPIISDCTKWFVDDKLKPGGDVSDVQKHFMETSVNEKKKTFWVAVLNEKLVGCVGAIPSTKYNPDKYCELVRMSVSAECRKVGIASRMIKVLEDWAREEGYEYVNLSTLQKMQLAVQLYTKNGYTLREEEQHNIMERLKTPEPTFITVHHFEKSLV